jgi:uncharacterized lipoprotein YmbA
MRHKMDATRLIGLYGLLVLTGCSLNRGAPPEQHYVLGGGRFQESAAAARDLGDIAVGVRRLQLAPYLGSNSVVVRQGSRAQELSLSEFHRWSEPLAEGINRAVAGYLTAGAPFRVVDVAPWPARAQHDYLIELHVLRFEGVAPAGPAATEGEAHVLATWAIVRPSDGEVLARGTTDYRKGGWRIGDYAALVALLDAGVYALSADLMSSLESLAAR